MMDSPSESPPRSPSAPAAEKDAPLIHVPASWTRRLDLKRLFPEEKPLEVELGSGDGGFMLAYARAHPETNFFAVERLKGRLGKLDRQGRRAGLANLRLIRIEASYFIQWLLPPNCVRAVHIYFPDPWPKRKHHKKRLINEAFADALEQSLIPGGRVYLRTDDADYFRRMHDVFQNHPAFQPIPTPSELLEFKTDFEKEFSEQGKQTHHAAFQLAD